MCVDIMKESQELTQKNLIIKFGKYSELHKILITKKNFDFTESFATCDK